jgi:lipopolysaccharide transport system ATP-binding protein
MNAIEVSNLTKIYKLYSSPKDRLKEVLTRKKHHHDFYALNDVSFTVEKGQTVGIIGQNGSGKSTLLQIICGVLRPTSGSVRTNGRIAALLELGAGFNPEFTGRENVYMNGALMGFNRDEMDRRFPEIEAFAEIGEFIDQPVKTYSSGMFVRLAFSAAINIDPEILVVDEALSVGDAAFQFKCVERLEKLTNSGTTLLLVSHDMGMLKRYCNKVLYLANGSERALGAADDVMERYMMDVRDDQLQSMKTGVRLVKKPSLNSGKAYGTSQGRVVAAEFEGGGSFGYFVEGENVSFWIDVEFSGSVRNPSLAVIVQDKKKFGIGGRFTRLARGENSNSLYRARVSCSFPVKFSLGRYFVVIRLEDRLSDSNFLIVDRQSGALSFEVARSTRRTILGTVDLDMEFSQSEFSACV